MKCSVERELNPVKHVAHVYMYVHYSAIENTSSLENYAAHGLK